MVTQQSIAKQLGISHATVSRILSNKSVHDDDTRAKVLSLASQLGYRHLRPTVRGRKLRSKALTVLGVLIETNDAEHQDVPVVSQRMLRGISEAARMERVALHIDYVSVQHSAQIHLLKNQPIALQEGHLSGLVLIGGFSVPAIQALTRQLPCGRLNIFDPALEVDCVGQHDLHAVDQLVEHLHQLGHRQIGFLGEPLRFWPIQARLAGYTLALTRRHLQYFPERVVLNATPARTSGWQDSHKQVAAQIQSGVRAWICNHDDVGYDLITYLQAHGLRVPEQVSLCGFDNLEPKSGLPKMTSIDWPCEDLGTAVVRRLLRRTSDLPAAPVHLMLRGRLVEGATTAPLFQK